jgi:hypothetical protein
MAGNPHPRASSRAAVWWCEIVKAGPVIRAARRHGGDIPAAARALGLVLTHDARVLARAPAVLARIEAGVGTKDRRWCTSSIKSTAAGGLKRKGEASGSYAQATARLRCAITKVAVTGSAPVAIVRGSSEMSPRVRLHRKRA